MVESSKILTVSYGTFSCTLEGFEDSFGTMKAIAEYFRDLAAGDRYFGAEPPIPDTEMLARIAEREISRRVEAHSDGNGIVLRAAALSSAAAMEVAPDTPQQDQPQETKAPIADPAPTAKARRVVTVRPAAPAVSPQPKDEAAASTTPAPAAAQDVPAREPLKDAEPAQKAEPATQDPVAASTDTPEIEPMPAMPPVSRRPETAPAAADLAAAEANAAARVADPQPAAPKADPAADTAVTTARGDLEPVAAQPASPPTKPAHPDSNSVAAKLQRIRAVVGKSPDLAGDDLIDDGYSEDLPTVNTDSKESIASVMAADEQDAQAPATKAPSTKADETVKADASPEKRETTPVDHFTFNDLADPAEESAGEPDPQTAMAENVLEPDQSTAAAEDVHVDELTAQSDATKDTGQSTAASVEDVVSDDAVAEDTLPAPVADSPAARTPEVSTAGPAEPIEAPQPVEAPKKPSLRARILRVGRLMPGKEKPKQEVAATAPAADPATASPELAAPEMPDAKQTPTSHDVAVPETPVAEDAATIAQSVAAKASDDSETLADTIESIDVAGLDGADELGNLAELGSAALSPDDEADLQRELADVDRENASIRAERPRRGALPEANDAEMSRIMDQADEELSNPEGSRRRNAIAQLKAAVAATEAARQLGDAADTAKAAETPFRDDLEQVVRPRRAALPDAKDLRSERPRPGPLKLVASQRVDLPDATPSEPVRPRRVAMSAPATQTDASSFADFAEQMGAKDLPDLLEAAAAYTAYVEGNEDFSRPQIMQKVQLTTQEQFSREDGLRSFGTLLRQGRISKVRNGRFQVSDQTRFKPEPKAAQG